MDPAADRVGRPSAAEHPSSPTRLGGLGALHYYALHARVGHGGHTSFVSSRLLLSPPFAPCWMHLTPLPQLCTFPRTQLRSASVDERHLHRSANARHPVEASACRQAVLRGVAKGRELFCRDEQGASIFTRLGSQLRVATLPPHHLRGDGVDVGCLHYEHPLH